MYWSIFYLEKCVSYIQIYNSRDAYILSVQLTEFSQIRHTFVTRLRWRDRIWRGRTPETTLMLISVTPRCNSWNKSGGCSWSWSVIWLPNWAPKFWCFVSRGNQRKRPCPKAQLSKYSFDLWTPNIGDVVFKLLILVLLHTPENY